MHNSSRVLQSKYLLYEATEEEMWFQLTRARINKAVAREEWDLAQKIVYEWAQGICEQIGLEYSSIWKYFKRALVAKWFGKPENKRFLPNWSTVEALEYAGLFVGRSVRFSLFPKDIACHAPSFRLSDSDRSNWESVLDQVDHSIAMEMFPEASTSDTICFRRYTTAFEEDVIYEAGKGQAMFAFEQERDQHPVVAATKRGIDTTFSYTRRLPNGSCEKVVREIEAKLGDLIATHDSALSTKCFGICRKLGIDYVSIEGYFDPAEFGKILIVDLDLAFDLVFMLSAEPR